MSSGVSMSRFAYRARISAALTTQLAIDRRTGSNSDQRLSSYRVWPDNRESSRAAATIWPPGLCIRYAGGHARVARRPHSATAKPHHELEKVLGFYSVVAIVVGQVIGSGIFFKPQVVAQSTGGFVGLILLLWVACGLVNLCGALTMGELGAMFPRAGGTYVFLHETYGPMWSFLWAWAEFWVIRTGAIAALAAYFAVALENVLFPGAGGSPAGLDLAVQAPRAPKRSSRCQSSPGWE